MNQNVSKLLATAMVVGLLTGSSALFADHHDKKGKDAAAAKGKNACKGKKANSCKGKKADKCSGKDGCTGKDHPADAAPAEGGEAHPE